MSCAWRGSPFPFEGTLAAEERPLSQASLLLQGIVGLSRPVSLRRSLLVLTRFSSLPVSFSICSAAVFLAVAMGITRDVLRL